MNKDKLAQELLKKVKPGIKPSDLKKWRGNGQILNHGIPTPPPTPLLKPKQENTVIPLIVREEATIHPKSPSLNKNQVPLKPSAKSHSTPISPEPKQYIFTCDICEQNKKSQLHLAKVNGLAINPTKLQKICSTCFKKVDLIQERKEDFF